MPLGRLFIVGIGPGAVEDMTNRAIAFIKASDAIVGYKTYVNLLGGLTRGKKVYSSGMMHEIERAKFAIGLAKEGKRVSLISSGDSGIYGMAGIALELLKDGEVGVEVIPGVTAASSAAALLGAPLMNDFAAISLSDLMTKWPDIKKRLQAAARADFVTALYNPKSKKRIHQLEDAQRIFLKYRKRTTPVGIVKNSGRVGETVIRTTLKDMLKHDIDMTTIVIIGNSQTFRKGDWIVTPRGYKLK